MIHSKRGGIGIATQSNWVANCEYADVQFANDTNGHAAALELLGANPNHLHIRHKVIQSGSLFILH